MEYLKNLHELSENGEKKFLFNRSFNGDNSFEFLYDYQEDLGNGLKEKSLTVKNPSVIIIVIK